MNHADNLLPLSEIDWEALDWIIFDAVGTLIDPNPSVAAAYWSIGKRHGVELSQEEVRLRFNQSFANCEQQDAKRHPRYATDETREYERWQTIITDVFPELEETTACFEELFEHFARPEHWCCFPDVEPTLAQLQTRGVKLAMASNFDSRLLPVTKGLKELDLLEKVIVSSLVGYRKPAPEFFKAALRETSSTPERTLYVGDSWENDYLGAQAAGLPALFLNRTNLNQPDGNNYASNDPSEQSGISSLTELLSLAGI